MKPLDSLIARSLPLVPKPIVRRFARPYVAGEHLDDALEAIQRLNADGCQATLDLLGESVEVRETAIEARQSYLEILDRITQTGVDSNVSLKLTQLGLKLDPDFCLLNLREVVEAAEKRANFVRIDMEDSSCTDATLHIYRSLREHHDNLGVVLQACLKRSPEDARALAGLGANVRVCKGIYIEPIEISWRDPQRIRDSFMQVVDSLMGAGCYVGVATHDDQLVERSWAVARKHGLGPGDFEFQMLYGVRPALARELLNRGARLRTYVPFGSHWYAYSVRRLRENPTIAGYVLKSLFSRG